MIKPTAGAINQEPPPTVHSVVLAAGTSSRYGEQNKLLEPVDGEPLVRHAVRTVCASSVDSVTVVVGYEAERVREAIADQTVNIRVNKAFKQGQSTSVAAGVEATQGRGADAAIFTLGDMPNVTVQSIEKLFEAYCCGAGTALAAAYDGTRGNPVIFDNRHFDTLSSVEGDVGGREILLNDPDAALVETDDPGVLQDIDHPADLRDLDTGR